MRKSLFECTVPIPVRTLIRAPGFTSVAVLTLALGVGVNTAIFSMVKAVLLDALPYHDPDRLVSIAVSTPGTLGHPDVDYTIADEWRARSRSFLRLSSYRDSLGVLIERDDAEMLRGLRVSYDFFDTLGVKMELGRSFRREEDRPGRRSEIILSHGLWLRHFGADPHIPWPAVAIERVAHDGGGRAPGRL
jgi:putative ABC transport system permease protein